ncbi:MAG: phosphate starvation-inducible protein PhoH [Firmicutes bacterium HGW-Firmicutes-14]|nr:MAG: phosphate starvation-inducible protein PhoH [Firmicutes bacterium HGW-Firmicutes-14]
MKKIFIIDTNVLLHDPHSVFKFQDNDVVIPLIAIEEMDNQKRRQDEVGRNARRVAKLIDELRHRGKIFEGVRLDNGGTLKVEMNHQKVSQLSGALEQFKADNRILCVALAYKDEFPDRKVILVTKDTYLRIKADVAGIEAEDFKTDKVNIEELYSGAVELKVEPEVINQFYSNSFLAWDKPEDDPGALYSNQFVSLVDINGSGQSALARFNPEKKGLVPLLHANAEAWGIRARNKEQRYAMELLLDDNIRLVTLVGQAGTGKTLLAVAAGLEKAIDEEVYKKLVVTRPVIPLGGDIGFLPGDKEEKMRPWMSPIYDNLEYIFGTGKESKKEKGDGEKPKTSNIETTIRYFKEKGQLELEALTYIRGRTMPRQYMIVDEAQNLTPHEVKTILTRAGEGTKVVLTGDPYQIDHPYLDSSSNGLTYVVEKFKGVKLAGHVTFIKGERSELAQLAAELI